MPEHTSTVYSEAVKETFRKLRDLKEEARERAKADDDQIGRPHSSEMGPLWACFHYLDDAYQKMLVLWVDLEPQRQ